jgi:predicted nucleic acid-binding protein
MIAVDTSVLVAALYAGDSDHASSREVLLSNEVCLYSHALSECFSILTGGSLGKRLPTDETAALIKDYLASRCRIISLSPTDLVRAYGDCEARGIRGGAIYDYLHLAAARKARAERLYTLNQSDFQAFHRPGDPQIQNPA